MPLSAQTASDCIAVLSVMVPGVQLSNWSLPAKRFHIRPIHPSFCICPEEMMIGAIYASMDIWAANLISTSFSGQGLDQNFSMECDDKEFIAAGADTTRVTLRITDEYGSIRRLCNDPISIEAEGPAILLGPKLFGLTGGTGAVLIRARQTPGCVRVTATHSVFGARSIAIALMASPKESV
jgi:Glycoside hydrolase family 2 C-terminal domain 5